MFKRNAVSILLLLALVIGINLLDVAVKAHRQAVNTNPTPVENQ